MKLENYLNLKTIAVAKPTQKILPLVATILITASLIMVFLVVPNEKIMGAVQRIFYFHVASAMNAYLMIGVLFFASSFYLVTKKELWDLLAASAAEISFVLCSVVLATGMIWGHSAWNTWWRWEPRLVSFLVLWFILFSYVVFRAATKGTHEQGVFSAIIGIVSAINVPIVIFSIKLLEHREQLHPEVVADRGLGDVRFVYALILTIVALGAFSLWLFALRARQQFLERQIKTNEVRLQEVQ